MEEEEEYIALLDRYFYEKASLEDIEKIELLEKENTDFAQFKREYEVIIKGIHLAERKALLEELKNVDFDMGAPDIKVSFWKISKKTTKWFIAASLTLILGFASWFSINETRKPEKLFNTYFQAYPNIAYIQERGGEKEFVSTEELAFRAYQIGRFEESLQLIHQLPTKENDISTLFYLGNIHLALNHLDSAIYYFDQVLEKKEDFYTQAIWYNSLTHIRSGEFKKAHTYLEELIQFESSYRKKALRLLEASGGKIEKY
jgi:tetratricopeptide (TPR) repeat protein